MLEAWFFDSKTGELLTIHQWTDGRRMGRREYQTIKESAIYNLAYTDTCRFEVYYNKKSYSMPILTGAATKFTENTGFFHIEPLKGFVESHFTRFHSRYFNPHDII